MGIALEFYTVDAFTKRAFGGNPAAVFVLPRDIDAADVSDELCQTIANEFNLAETAFARRLKHDVDEEEEEAMPVYSLRFWTPTYEIPLCGHATLATASTLFKHQHTEAVAIRFETRTRGSLVATREDSRSTGSTKINLDLPSSSLVTLRDGDERRERILSQVDKIAVERDDVLRIDWADEIKAYVVELSNTVDLPALDFDPFILLAIGDMVILTQPAPPDSQFDVYSRVFGPDVEIPEDPVTGSAHTALAPFWFSTPSLERLYDRETIDDTGEFRAKQVSRRAGEMTVRFDRANGRVGLASWATQVMQGTLEL